MLDKDYFAAELLSNSGGKDIRQSPKVFRHKRDNPTPPSAAMQLGSLTHGLTLQPELVASQFSTGPDLSKMVFLTKEGKPATSPAATTEGKAFIAAWYAENAHLTVVSNSDWALASAMSAAMLAAVHPRLGLTLADLLVLRGTRVEEAILWTDAETGAKCKAKIDCIITLASGEVMIVDLKTTRSALTTRELASAMASFEYFVQGAVYLEALAQGGVCEASFWLLWVSSAAPHETAWTAPTVSALLAGHKKWQQAKQVYAACVKTGLWPSAQECGLVSDELDLPRWAQGVSDGE